MGDEIDIDIFVSYSVIFYSILDFTDWRIRPLECCS